MRPRQGRCIIFSPVVSAFRILVRQVSLAKMRRAEWPSSARERASERRGVVIRNSAYERTRTNRGEFNRAFITHVCERTHRQTHRRTSSNGPTDENVLVASSLLLFLLLSSCCFFSPLQSRACVIIIIAILSRRRLRQSWQIGVYLPSANTRARNANAASLAVWTHPRCVNFRKSRYTGCNDASRSW